MENCSESPYQVKLTPLVMRLVLVSKKNGDLQKLKEAYEREYGTTSNTSNTTNTTGTSNTSDKADMAKECSNRPPGEEIKEPMDVDGNKLKKTRVKTNGKKG